MVKELSLKHLKRKIFQNKIEIIYSDEVESYHYSITPYNYRPKIATKITSESYYDLGQGIMDLIYEINKKNEI